MKPVIETHDLCKTYDGRVVVDHLNLTVLQGCVYGFLGPNGAGKSTSMKMMLGLVHQSRGSILLRVLDVSKGREILQKQGIRVSVKKSSPGVLELPELSDEMLAALVRTLAENGAGVVELTAQTKSLEEIFLSLTKNGGEVA